MGVAVLGGGWLCWETSGRIFDFFFFFNDTATTEIYTLSLHDALPIWGARHWNLAYGTMVIGLAVVLGLCVMGASAKPAQIGRAHV